jgi:polyketide cyclase/dehydrase/lipid transport protein
VWQTEHSTETSAAPETIWQLWSDVADWPRWNADLDRAELAGPFAEGTGITMFPRNDDPIEVTIAEADEPRAFIDQADLGSVIVRTEHRVEPVGPSRSRIVYRMEITGPEADTLGPQIGPQITSDFPDVLAKLAAVAEGR